MGMLSRDSRVRLRAGRRGEVAVSTFDGVDFFERDELVGDEGFARGGGFRGGGRRLGDGGGGDWRLRFCFARAFGVGGSARGGARGLVIERI